MKHLWIEKLRSAEKLPESFAADVVEYLVPLSKRIHDLYQQQSMPVVIGINGAQGSGKTTVTLFLTECLRRDFGLRVATLSLDDLYLSKADREKLAQDQHPLLATRGVPGTHDVALGEKLIRELTEQGKKNTVSLPVFDQASDDQLPRSEWRKAEAPVDVVLFEGWCVGARPQRDADLRDPVNALEAQDDTGGRWRSFVNRSLANDYAELFSQLDELVMLRIPSFDKVLEWRELQEQKIVGEPGMNSAELRDFVMHFERLTRHMLARMPNYANTVIDLDDSHRMVGMQHQP
jgi:D-glycerate 3-kinase